MKKSFFSLGGKVEGKKFKKVICELNGKSIEELITKGRKKLSSMPIGGSAAAAAKQRKRKINPNQEDDDDCLFD